MKKHVVAFALAGLASALSSSVHGQEPVGGADVAAVIKRIKRELQVAQATVIGEPRLELSEVALELKTAATRSADGGFKINIPFVGADAGAKASTSAARTQTVNLSLSPPKPLVLQSADDEELDLARAIIAIRRQLNAGLKEEPVLLPRKLDIDVLFGVKAAGGGSAGVKLVVFEASAVGGYAEESSQKITLKFSAPRGP